MTSKPANVAAAIISRRSFRTAAATAGIAIVSASIKSSYSTDSSAARTWQRRRCSRDAQSVSGARAEGARGRGERVEVRRASRSPTLCSRVCLSRDRTPVPRQLVALPPEPPDRPDGRPQRYHPNDHEPRDQFERLIHELIHHPDEQEPKISPRGFIKPEEYLAQSL